MDYLEEACKEKLIELEGILRQLEERPHCPSGEAIEICNCRGNIQFYRKVLDTENGKMVRQYVKKEDRELVHHQIQGEYNRKAAKTIRNQLHRIRGLLSHYDGEEIFRLYDKCGEERKKLITPIILSPDEYIRKWIESGSGQDNPIPVSGDNITDRGELVRSKSEKILADKFYHMNIPYKYEAGLSLEKSGGTRGDRMVYPDFTLLNRRTLKVYYWEHLGMMANPGYVADALSKIEKYERCGIFPGEQLILTYESTEHPLNFRAVDQLIRHYLL